ncbi:T9SS type A sorting domain-containing protein [Lutibacter sp.]|uniref:T9SS type A sorting domain-containing protein n=1 Tax=Lutibacter sp. TaxID=1925666 RepID=UPI0027361D2F|nr:T9SS type A sorting domain-containing protein [Lutibacter sp.]MDP3313921.1 T9SS type A sorting domain-containing protein [Lutibacter sp.]
MKKKVLFTILLLLIGLISFSQVSDLRPKFRIGFDAPKIDHRQLLLTIDENTTDGVDWGYDAEIYQIFEDDMYWILERKKYVIQATNIITEDKEFLLGVRTISGGTVSIKLDAIENPISGFTVHLIDKHLNETYDIQNNAYKISLSPGEYHNRFAIKFKKNAIISSSIPTPSIEEISIDTSIESVLIDENIENEIIDNNEINSDSNKNKNNFHSELVIHVNNSDGTIKIKNNRLIKINKVAIFNFLGLKIQSWEKGLNGEYLNLQVNNLRRGIFIINIFTDEGILSKKVLNN